MANYYGQSRTNYFAVKDAELFEKELENHYVEVITKEINGVTLYGFIDTDDNGNGLSWQVYNEDEDEHEDFDWIEFLAKHVANDHVAILMEVGSEKYRYFMGNAWAVNSKGETKTISLDNIYTLAEELGHHITTATY